MSIQYSPVSKLPYYFRNLGKIFFISAQDITEEKNIFFKHEVIKSHSQLNLQSAS